MNEVSNYFRPEFLNRIDEVVVFHALIQKQIMAIAEIQIEHLKQRLHEQDIAIEVSADALNNLGLAGFDPVYGARPLKRAIQDSLETPIAEKILSGNYGPGSLIKVGTADGKLQFTELETNAA